MENTNLFKVSGLGVSFIGPACPVLWGWVNEIIRRGGVPVVTPINENEI